MDIKIICICTNKTAFCFNVDASFTNTRKFELRTMKYAKLIKEQSDKMKIVPAIKYLKRTQ